MSQEEFQKQVLDSLNELKTDVVGLESKVTDLDTKIGDLDAKIGLSDVKFDICKLHSHWLILLSD